MKQKELKMTLEIDKANIEEKQIKNFEFERCVVKLAKLCIRRLIKKEFKFNKVISSSKLMKYNNYLELNIVLESFNESTDKTFF